MPKIKLVIFDWAGTIIDYGCQAPLEAFAKAFENNNILVDKDDIKQFMGIAKREHIKKVLELPHVVLNRPLDDMLIDQIYTDFKKQLTKTIPQHLDFTPGYETVIKHLDEKGIKVGSTTGYTYPMVSDIMHRHSQSELLPYTPRSGEAAIDNSCATSDTVDRARPGPALIYQILRHYANKGEDIKILETVKVGDTLADIDEATSCGCWAVGVIESSSMMGLTLKEFESLSKDVQDKRKAEVARKFQKHGANFAINNLKELPALLHYISNLDTK